MKKYVLHRSFLQIFLTTCALSNFTFREHLGHLFDVISSLDSQRPQQLLNFNLFIHHRVFRKLGWRTCICYPEGLNKGYNHKLQMLHLGNIQ